MTENFKIINKEISRIKKERDVQAIIAVGSGKSKVLKAQGINVNDQKKEDAIEDVIDFAPRNQKEFGEVNDIDIFIITSEDEKKQLRQIKNIEDMEFDLNYFPYELAKAMIDQKLQYFIEELSQGEVVYDPKGFGRELISLSENAYESGPLETTRGNLAYLKYNLESKLKSISKLGDETEDKTEFFFLSSLWLKNLLVYYFKLNDMWVPEDKKMLEIIQKEDELLYDKIKRFYQGGDPKLLKDIAGYVFYEDGIKLGDEMRFKFKF